MQTRSVTLYSPFANQEICSLRDGIRDYAELMCFLLLLKDYGCRGGHHKLLALLLFVIHIQKRLWVFYLSKRNYDTLS